MILGLFLTINSSSFVTMKCLSSRLGLTSFPAESRGTIFKKSAPPGSCRVGRSFSRTPSLSCPLSLWGHTRAVCLWPFGGKTAMLWHLSTTGSGFRYLTAAPVWLYCEPGKPCLQPLPFSLETSPTLPTKPWNRGIGSLFSLFHQS